LARKRKLRRHQELGWEIESSFFRIRDFFLDTFIEAKELALAWPDSKVKRRDVAARFEEKSTNHIYQRCVGAVDGMLVKINQPDGVTNPRAYFSGHYQCMGDNVQAVCDANLRYSYIATAAPGSTPTSPHIETFHSSISSKDSPQVPSRRRCRVHSF